ncbi:hypothetical protein [Bacillus methanolicus]
MLLSNALVKLDARKTYYFCSTPSCNAVYFNEEWTDIPTIRFKSFSIPKR